MLAGNRWVTFDCFGTLVDWQGWFAATLAPLVGDGVRDLERAYLAHEQRVQREQPLPSYKDAMVASLLRAGEQLGVLVSAADAAAIRGTWSSMRPFSDVEVMLAGLRRGGWRLAVLTNCDDDLFEITHRGFRRPFDLFVTSERVRGFKPERWHFRAFEQMTGVTREHWVHVSSRVSHDTAPAWEHGINHVWLDRTGAKAGDASSLRVRSATAVPDAVEALARMACSEPEPVLAGEKS